MAKKSKRGRRPRRNDRTSSPKMIQINRIEEDSLLIDSSKLSPWAKRAVAAIIMALPFFVLYWLVPFLGKYSIGNDYQGYWIDQQQYLLFSVSNGTFPLYAPGFAGGWTASAMTLGQLWYPGTWIAAMLPGYWDGHALQIGTLLKLLSLGGTHLVLFAFLKRMRLATVLAFVISFVTVYNLRMLDMFRYGASLENYLAQLLLCTALAWHYVTPTKRAGPLAIAISTWLLVVGGHPQFMYLGLLGAAVVCLAIPFYMACLLPGEVSVQRRKLRSYYLSVGVSVAVGFLLALPYILPYYFEYISDSTRGGGMSFRWACAYQDTLAGSLSNFFNPFNSNVCGAFGGSSLVLLALLAPLLFLLRIRVQWSVLYIWAAYVVTFVLMLGSNGPLYYYFWKYFPLAQNFRIPGRLSVVLPFMILLLLIWVIRQRPLQLRVLKRKMRLLPLAILAVIAAVLFVVLNILPQSFIKHYGAFSSISPARLNDISSVVVTLTIAFGVTCLLSLIFFGSPRIFGRVAAVVLVATVLLQVTATLRYGTWIAPAQIKKPTIEQFSRRLRQRAAYPVNAGAGEGSTAVIQCLRHTFAEPSLARICREHTTVASQEEAYARLARQRSIDRIFVENYSPVPAKVNPLPFDNVDSDSVELKYNSFNNLTFDVTSARPSFFVFSFPYSSHWQAKVNSKSAAIYRANGIEQAVRIPAGKSTIQLRYWSWSTIAGVAIGCLTLLSVALYLLAAWRARTFRRFAMLAAMCLCAFVLFIWYHSLYHGGNLGTKYTWSTEDFQPNLSSQYNLAYGKQTSMSRSYSYYNDKDAPLGVDGQRIRGRGFSTSATKPAFWQVDLGRIEPIGEIVLYKHYRKCDLPFDVIASQDGKRGMHVETITEPGDDTPWRIRPRNLKARYIRLQTRNKGSLNLAEVEIYAPENIGLGNHTK